LRVLRWLKGFPEKRHRPSLAIRDALIKGNQILHKIQNDQKNALRIIFT